jgi:DNA-binding MarR family transcriptional regulator
MIMTMPPSESVMAKLAPEQEQAWFGLLRAHSHVMRRVEADLAASHQLPFSTVEILCHLRIAPEPQSVNLLAGQLVSVSPTRASRLIQRLVDDGYVTRSSDQADGRVSLISLTPAGEQLALKVSDSLKDSIAEQFIAPLDEDDLAAMDRIWRKLKETPVR